MTTLASVPVIWNRTVNDRHGKRVKLERCTLISADGTWGTVQLADERFSVLLTDLRLLKNGKVENTNAN